MPYESQQPPNYTLPLLDLAFEADLQTVVDREPGQYLGHPTTVLLDDGKTIIAVYPKGHGRGAIVMKRSEDGGLTWGERLPTPHNWETSMEVPTIYPAADRQGKKRLVMFSGGGVMVRMAVSEDDGRTWTPLRPIGDYGGIVAMADMVPLKDGRHMAFFHGMNRRFVGKGQTEEMVSPDSLATRPAAAAPAPEAAPRGPLATPPPPKRGTGTIYKVVSEDGGLTWGEPEVACEHPDAGICEPGIVRSPDGGQMAMLLRENRRMFNSFVSFSDDEGGTWSEPRELPASLTGDRHQAVYAPDGRLFVSFRDMARASLTKGDWVGWVGTYEDIVEGREGEYRVRIMQNHRGGDCAYPALERLPCGTILAITYGHWINRQEPFIMAVRFKLEELDAMPKWTFGNCQR